MHKGLKLLFVINPKSGTSKINWEEAIRNYFKDKTHSIQFYLLTSANDKMSIRHHIDSFQPDRVVAVGGDGTVQMLAAMLKETALPLAILPAGSANGMARELNIPLNAEAALKIITDGQLRKIDLIKINEEKICIHLSDMGLNALVIKYFEAFRQRGWAGYAKAFWKVIWNKQKFRVTIKTDKTILRRKAYMVVLGNATRYGLGAVINPQGSVSDGAFEVIIVRKLNVFAVLNSMISQKPFHPEKIEIIKTTAVEIQTQKNHHFQIDGEYQGKISRISARILPGVLQLVLPPEAGTGF